MANKKVRRSSRPDVLGELRALLGRVRSRGFNVDDRRRAYVYRTGLQAVLLNARLHHAKGSAEKFFDVLREMTRLEAARFSRQPIAHDFLLQLLTADPLPLDLEVRWVSARLHYERQTLGSHLAAAEEIQRSIHTEQQERSLARLDEHEEELGVSLWSTELRLALTQASRGLEAQKAVLNQIRATRRKGMWPYVANAASVRAEPSVSIGWFIEENRRRLDRHKGGPFTDYLRYRGAGSWPETDAARAQILRVEQNHHVVDLYETFVSLLQELATRPRGNSLSSACIYAIQHLRPIQDFRLRKLEFAFQGLATTDLPLHDLRLTDLLLEGAPYAEIRSAIRKQYRSDVTLEGLAAAALATDHAQVLRAEHSSQKQLVVRGLAQALQRSSYRAPTGERPDERLRKLAHTYSTTPFGKATVSLLDAAGSPRAEGSIRRLQIAALNSPVWGFFDLVGFALHAQHNSIISLFDANSTRQFAEIVGAAGSSEPVESLREDVQSLARAARELLAGRSHAVSVAASPALASESRLIAAHAAVLVLNAYIRTGEVSEASALIAREHVENSVDSEAMPVRDIYEGIAWRDMRDAASGPELSIALSLIQSSDGDDRLRTYRRFALETLLNKVEKKRPSELRSVATTWPSAYLVYFLEHVCTSAMVDMLPSIKSSREVLEERRDICGYLATIDKPRSEQHRQEVLEISRELTVLDGLRTIDGSRVHVDRESLTRRLKADLAESFQRYSSLSKTKEAAADGIATIVRDFAKEQQPDYLLSMPTSEPDELLVSMFLQARRHFLFNVPHGLDSYISKRIRHGSIVGVIRAPAEREGVVARRNLDGSYRAGGTWADTVSDPQQRAALVAAIAHSSRAIDQYLLRLKDVLLHVKSDDKPHGLFDAVLTPPTYLVIRSFASSDASLDSFVDTLMKSLWVMLTPSLSEAQALLTNDSVAFVSDQFQSLRARAQRILTSTEERAEFDAVAVKASVGMQSALVTAASWFEPMDSNPRSYSLSEVVDIAVESVRATTVGFAPVLDIRSNSEFSFSELALPLICDVLYIALGNVAMHSRSGFSPQVVLEVNRDEKDEYIIFRVENELGPMSIEELQRLEAKLLGLRTELKTSKGGERARTEGGSGLHKLAALVSQTDGDSLEFGCDASRFELIVTLSYSPERPF